MINAKEFLDPEFRAFCQQEFDSARQFLKNCGRPADRYDRALIFINKETANIFAGFLNPQRSQHG